MARTKKSRGGDPFKLRSGNSPNKFLGIGKALGGLGKAALGGIGNMLGGSRLFGGRRGGATASGDMMGGPMMGMGPLTKKKKYKN